MKNGFSKISQKAENITGHPATFSIALIIILAWTLGGLFHGFTSYYLESFIAAMELVAILLLLILQRATNVGTDSIQLKLNELLRATEGGGERLDIEDKSDAERQEAREQDRREATR